MSTRTAGIFQSFNRIIAERTAVEDHISMEIIKTGRKKK